MKIKKHNGKTIDIIEGYKVIECIRCGFKHVYPIPTEQELDKLYSESFYRNEKPKYFKDAEEDYEWWMLTYKNYYHLFEKHVRGRKILDIGSGPGYFLKCGKDLGWDTFGFEPSKQAFDYSKKLGINIINDFFSLDYTKKIDKFDVVFLSLVLEHLPDPKKLINDLKKVLKPSGIICIISPNDYNPFQDILVKHLNFNPWWVVPLQHINYFNFDSIKKLLKSLGFKVVDLSGTFPMEYFLLSGDNYVGNNKLGRICHSKRKEFEKNLYLNNPDLLNTLYGQLAKKNIGREFVIIGKKS